MRSTFSVVQQLYYSMYVQNTCSIFSFNTDTQVFLPEHLQDLNNFLLQNISSVLVTMLLHLHDFTFRSARSPEQHSSVRTGISIERNKIYCILPQLVIPHLCCLLVYIQRSFPAFQTDGFCIHHVPRFHEHLFLYGNMENSLSVSVEVLLHRIIVSINLPIIECSLVPIR